MLVDANIIFQNTQFCLRNSFSQNDYCNLRYSDKNFQLKSFLFIFQAGLDKNCVDDVIETIQTFDAAQQAKVGRECELEPTDEQLVRILTRFNDNRFSKLMRECAFVPRSDDFVHMLSNLEPGSQNTILSRVNWEAPLSWLVNQVEKLNRTEMERIVEIISTKVCMPEEAIINTLRFAECSP